MNTNLKRQTYMVNSLAEKLEHVEQDERVQLAVAFANRCSAEQTDYEAGYVADELGMAADDVDLDVCYIGYEALVALVEEAQAKYPRS